MYLGTGQGVYSSYMLELDPGEGESVCFHDILQWLGYQHPFSPAATLLITLLVENLQEVVWDCGHLSHKAQVQSPASSLTSPVIRAK